MREHSSTDGGNYSPYSIALQRPHYTTEMALWCQALPDVHWVYGQGWMTIHFAQEEDVTAFKITFKI
jgi:hypothetical protein